MTTDADLRRLAEQALASEDELRPDWWELLATSLDGSTFDENDAAYIAAANPQAILALLDERDMIEAARLRNARDAFNAWRRVASLTDALYVRERDAIRATVERLLDADDWKHEALKILDEEAAR